MLCYNITYLFSFTPSMGAGMAVLFFPRKPNHQWNAVLGLKKYARTVINADDETIVCISERDCGDPACGGARTIVLIIHPTRPVEAVGIDKPLGQITQADLSGALAPLVAQTGPPEAPSKPKLLSLAPAH
jgi:hypothetical protein